MKIPNPYCTSARHAQSYPRISSVYSWKCRCTSSDKLFDFRPSFEHSGKNRNSETLLNIYKTFPINPRVSFVYSLKYRVPVTTALQKRHFLFWIDPWGKNENFKTFCASASHVQSDSRKSFGYDLRCKLSLSDKKSSDGQRDGKKVGQGKVQVQ